MSSIARRFSSSLSANSIAPFLGASLQVVKVIKTKKSPPNPKSHRTLNDIILPQTYLNIIPDNLMRLSAKLRAEEISNLKLVEACRIKLVNGEKVRLRGSANSIASSHSQGSRDETKAGVNRQRFCSRIHGFVLQFAAGSDDPYLRLPVWRLARVEQSTDMRTLTILWTIDDPDEARRYQEPIRQSWARASSNLRHQLASRFSLRFAPNIQIKYEDFTAINLAKELEEH